MCFLFAFVSLPLIKFEIAFVSLPLIKIFACASSIFCASSSKMQFIVCKACNKKGHIKLSNAFSSFRNRNAAFSSYLAIQLHLL